MHQKYKLLDDSFPSLSLIVALHPSIASSVGALHALLDLNGARSRLIIALDADEVLLLFLQYCTALCEGDSLVLSSFMLIDASHCGFDFDFADCCYTVPQLSFR